MDNIPPAPSKASNGGIKVGPRIPYTKTPISATFIPPVEPLEKPEVVQSWPGPFCTEQTGENCFKPLSLGAFPLNPKAPIESPLNPKALIESP